MNYQRRQKPFTPEEKKIHSILIRDGLKAAKKRRLSEAPPEPVQELPVVEWSDGKVVSEWAPICPSRPWFPETMQQGSSEFHKFILDNLQKPIVDVAASHNHKLSEEWEKHAKAAYWECWWDWYKHNWREFWKDCLWIMGKDKKKQRLDINNWMFRKAQNRFVDMMEKQMRERGRIRIIILKARQWGGSTLTKAAELTLCIFWPNTAELTIADDNLKAANMLQLLQDWIADLPEWLAPTLKNAAAGHIRFNGFKNLPVESRSELWVASAGNVNIGRSLVLTNIHASEAAFWGKNTKRVLVGVRGALADVYGSLCVLESTANGWGGEFYDEWVRAVERQSGFEPLFVPATDIDEYFIQANDGRLNSQALQMTEADRLAWLAAAEARDWAHCTLLHHDEQQLIDKGLPPMWVLWRRQALRERCAGDEQQFNQEFPLTPDEAFIASGSPAFSPSALRMQMERAKKTLFTDGDLAVVDGQLTLVPSLNGSLRVFALPQQGHDYIVSCDASSGSELWVDYVKAGDNSAIIVRDRHERKVVARHVGRTAPVDLARIIGLLIIWYNRPWVIVENNSGWGLPVIEPLRDAGYGKMYTRKVVDSITKAETHQWGWTTTKQTRPLLFSTARAKVSENIEELSDTLLISEMITMVNRAMPSNEVRAEAKPGCKDDIAFAWALNVRYDYELGPVPPLQGSASGGLLPTHPDYWVWKNLEDETNARIAEAQNDLFGAF